MSIVQSITSNSIPKKKGYHANIGPSFNHSVSRDVLRSNAERVFDVFTNPNPLVCDALRLAANDVEFKNCRNCAQLVPAYNCRFFIAAAARLAISSGETSSACWAIEWKRWVGPP
jgi:hypothetical protein